MILALLATLGAIVTAFVLYPVFTEAPATGFVPADESARKLSDLSDKKAMLYEAIQELDFEKDSGKISATDYEAQRTDYLAQVAAVIEKIDAIAPKKSAPAAKTKPGRKSKKAAPADRDQKAEQVGLECSSCGASNPKGSKFCLECGNRFGVTCASCGENLPAGARFCNACGEKVTA